MTQIVFAVIIVAGIGILAGLLLSVLSKLMAVKVDEKALQIEEVLPGANCGACGFAGCSAYASALSQGETTDTSLCAPGGNEASKKIAGIMGLAAGNIMPMTAVVCCKGTRDKAETKMIYSGVPSCKMASQLFGGDKNCTYGCLGLGDCARACPYDAILLCDGVAVVNPSLCRACRMCVNTCPKNLIELMPKGQLTAAVLCKNHNKGAQTRKDCTTGCIGCTKCVKACPNNAVTMDNFVARVDNSLCTACGACSEVCPTKAIDLIKL